MAIAASMAIRTARGLGSEEALSPAILKEEFPDVKEITAWTRSKALKCSKTVKRSNEVRSASGELCEATCEARRTTASLKTFPPSPFIVRNGVHDDCSHLFSSVVKEICFSFPYRCRLADLVSCPKQSTGSNCLPRKKFRSC